MHPGQALLPTRTGSTRQALYLAQVANHTLRRADGGEVRGLRADLRKQMHRISRLAIVKLEGMPGIEEDARVPHANAKAADLVDAAARLTKNLRPHVRTLYRGGLSKDAFTRMNATAKALAAKSSSPDTAIARRSRATSSIPAAITRARAIVRALDPAVREELAGNALALHAWTKASRIPGRIGRPKKRRPPND